jgi:ABC-type branched-subunit amino acid transport system substrate-binding protein
MRFAQITSRALHLCSLTSALLLAACAGESARTTPGVSGDTISLGALSPLSDAVAVIGKPIVAGLQTYFDALNAKGGIGGKYRVRLLVEDVTYANPSTSVQKYQKLKSDVVMMAQILGTDHINTVLPLLSEDSMVAVPTTFDGEWVREPHLIPWGPPYQISAMNGIAYFLSESGGGASGKRVCALAIATGYGGAGLEGVEFAAKEMGFQVASVARFKQDDQDFVAPITQLKNARCDGVFLVSLPGVTGRLLGAAAQLNFTPRWIAQMPSWHPSLAESPLRDYLTAHLWVAWTGPEWGDTTVAGMREMLAAIKQYRPDQKPDLYFVAGWNIGQLTHQTLERAVANGDLSRAGMLRAVQQLGAVTFDGLIGTYTYGSVDQREPVRASAIFRINPSKPVALELIAPHFESPIARKFTFGRTVR